MVSRIFMTLLAFLPLAATVEGGVADRLVSSFSKPLPEKKAAIKILIVHDKPGAVVEVKGKYKIYDPNTKDYISTRFVGKRKFIQAVQDGLKWGEEFPGVYQLLIIPDSATTTTLVDGIEYQGSIYVYDVEGAISIVNEIGYDDYLNSMLASQLRNIQLPQQALAAAVIAARTNAMYQVQNPKTNFWAVDGRKIGYQGHALIDPSNEIQKAIEETHNMVMSLSSSFATPIKPFPVQWDSLIAQQSGENPVVARISLSDAAELAKQGDHSAQILKKAFPNTIVRLIKE